MSHLLKKKPRERRRAALTTLRSLQAEIQGMKQEIAALKTLAVPASPVAVSAPSDRNRRLMALLDSFETGDAEQQRRDLAEFQAGIDAARPGQRRLFGEGTNP
jgi:hypothetical protein